MSWRRDELGGAGNEGTIPVVYLYVSDNLEWFFLVILILSIGPTKRGSNPMHRMMLGMKAPSCSLSSRVDIVFRPITAIDKLFVAVPVLVLVHHLD